MRRRLFFSLFFSIAFYSCYAQQGEATIHLQSDKSTFTIRQNKIYYIEITGNLENDSVKSIKSLKGKFISSSSHEIMLIPSRSTIKSINKDSIKQSIETFYPLNTRPVSFRYDDISMISYQSNSAHNCLVSAKIMTVIGLLTTFVVAPLASIDYRNGSINSRTYFTFAATGLGLYILSIPLFLISKEKKFHLNLNGNSKEKCWKVN